MSNNSKLRAAAPEFTPSFGSNKPNLAPPPTSVQQLQPPISQVPDQIHHIPMMMTQAHVYPQQFYPAYSGYPLPQYGQSYPPSMQFTSHSQIPYQPEQIYQQSPTPTYYGNGHGHIHNSMIHNDLVTTQSQMMPLVQTTDIPKFENINNPLEPVDTEAADSELNCSAIEPIEDVLSVQPLSVIDGSSVTTVENVEEDVTDNGLPNEGNVLENFTNQDDLITQTVASSLIIEVDNALPSFSENVDISGTEPEIALSPVSVETGISPRDIPSTPSSARQRDNRRGQRMGRGYNISADSLDDSTPNKPLRSPSGNGINDDWKSGAVTTTSGSTQFIARPPLENIAILLKIRDGVRRYDKLRMLTLFNKPTGGPTKRLR